MTKNFVNQIDRLLKISKKILLVEHDPVKRGSLERFLKQQKHEVEVAKDGMTASEKINTGTYDLFIIDRSLPYNDAMTLYRSIKNKNLKTPVVFIVDQEDDEVFFSIKYDSFEKDFGRIMRTVTEQSLQSKEQENQKEPEVYKIGGFTLDPRKRVLRYKDGDSVKLTPKETKLLKLLIMHNNKLVHKNTLQKKVWYNDENVSFGSMNVYISRLRKLLKKDKNVNITNVYKTGFKISG